MTHQQNKQFNTYKEGLDLEFLREYCMEHGERRVMERGETLEEAGEPAQWVAYVERGCFKYMVHNDEEGKDYCRLPLLPRRRLVGGEHRGGHAVRGARHQRTGAAGPD